MSNESIKSYDLYEKKVKKNKKIKPFKHLKSKIDIDAINNVPIHLLDKEKLPESKRHFQKIKEKHSSNFEIVEAADNIIKKIENIINLGKKDFSGEIMKAANGENYFKEKSA